MLNKKMRYQFITVEDSLPLFVESVGYNPQEMDFLRTRGYPYYHWLLTIDGEGKFYFDGQEYSLSKGRGILLKPYTPHSYYTEGKRWSTVYITFGGASAVSILESLKLNSSTMYTDLEDLPFLSIILDMFQKVETDSEFSKLELSSFLFDYLIKLRTYGKANNQLSLSHYYGKVRGIVEWLESVYAEDVTLSDIASTFHMSPQYLNRLFRDTLAVSPYSFLIQLRISKAKEIMVQNPDIPLKTVAILVGFNDLSYFVATFKRREGITPRKYREMYV
ncbi:AraC family transcriptional regulator [Paenibacillus sambharensis]|nr:AraC family transcriptional regulator [Paenibacillus sambharensis]